MFKFIIKRSNNRRLKTLANNLIKNNSKIFIDNNHKSSTIKSNIESNKQKQNKDKMNEKNHII